MVKLIVESELETFLENGYRINKDAFAEGYVVVEGEERKASVNMTQELSAEQIQRRVAREHRRHAQQEAQLLEELRLQREAECFSVVNRGQLWYSTLSPVQSSELTTWYKKWLEVTKSREIPTVPDWLIEKKGK